MMHVPHLPVSQPQGQAAIRTEGHTFWTKVRQHHFGVAPIRRTAQLPTVAPVVARTTATVQPQVRHAEQPSSPRMTVAPAPPAAGAAMKVEACRVAQGSSCTGMAQRPAAAPSVETRSGVRSPDAAVACTTSTVQPQVRHAEQPSSPRVAMGRLEACSPVVAHRPVLLTSRAAVSCSVEVVRSSALLSPRIACRAVPGTGLDGVKDQDRLAGSAAPSVIFASDQSVPLTSRLVHTAASLDESVASEEIIAAVASQEVIAAMEEQRKAHQRDVVVLEQMLQYETAEKAAVCAEKAFLKARLTALEVQTRSGSDSGSNSLGTTDETQSVCGSDTSTVIMFSPMTSDMLPSGAGTDQGVESVETRIIYECVD